MLRRDFVAFIAGLVLIDKTVRADCNPSGYSARFMTRSQSVIPQEGGVLVGLSENENQRTNRDPFEGEWTLVREGRSSSLQPRILGPGLMLLPIQQTGRLTVQGSIGSLEVIRDNNVARVQLPVPSIRSATVHRAASYLDLDRVTVQVAGMIPRNIAFAVLRNHSRQGARGCLTSLVTPGTSFINFTTQLQRCSSNIPNSFIPSLGSRIDVIYVDWFGRISEPSQARQFA